MKEVIAFLRSEAGALAQAAEKAEYHESVDLFRRSAAFYRAANLLVDQRNIAKELEHLASRLRVP